MASVTRFLAALAACLVWALAALAQETAPETDVLPSAAEELVEEVGAEAGSPDYDQWAKVANRAERSLDTARASDQAFETLRAEVADWRDIFSEAREANAVRIATLRNQIDALGPAPEEGEEEGQALADQRATLNERLSNLEAPNLAADLAFARADTIISEIDALLRSRQSEALFTLGPSPANPIHWPDAIAEFKKTLRQAWAGTLAAVNSEAQRAALKRELAPVIVLLLIGLLLALRGRRFVASVGRELVRGGSGPSRGVRNVLVSLGQMIVPVVGLFLLVLALNISGLMGLRAQLISEMVLALGVNLIVARWLAGRVFGVANQNHAVLELQTAGQSEMRFEAILLGLAYGLYILVERLADFETYSDATRAVLGLPVIVLGGVLMLRMGRVIRISRRPLPEDESEDEALAGGFAGRTLAIVGRVLIIVGIAGPGLSLLGYGKLGGTLVFSTALSFALVGALLILHRFFVDFYGMIRRFDDDEAGQALLPVLASAFALLASVPVFALIWGAREAEIGEIWAAVWRGVTIGEAVISPSDVLLLAAVFAIGLAATRLVQGMLKSTVLPKTKIDIGGRNAISAGVGYVGIFLAALVAVSAVGINLSSLAVVAGALSLGIGFGLQTIVSNFVSGIILLIERPISEGDWIVTGDQMGIVKNISVRSTRIETFDRTDVIVPNSDLISGVVTNYTRGNRVGRLVIDLGVAYGSDTKKVSEVLMEVVSNHPVVVATPPPAVTFMNFGADALEFQIRAILSDVFTVLTVRDEINHEIARRFAEEGIEMPFAQRDIWIRNPEVLPGGGD